ncbi:DoxX family protein [Sulfurospirillum arcachonense]|uniref:DoxX family protein n=1 Tax=Sulfurospirillum arcachonense TaxID=57666 RepID=UPI0004683887|nr:DoxX family protein [Sulfurospirillum arcachonense]
MRSLENFLGSLLSADIGKLILRLMLGILMLFHGYKKYESGIAGIKGLVVRGGFPEFFAYGVYIGEIVVPILIIVGLYTRISSAIYAFTLGFAIYLVYFSKLFALNAKTGGLIIETPLLFMLGAIVLMFIGAGKFSIDRK